MLEGEFISEVRDHLLHVIGDEIDTGNPLEGAFLGTTIEAMDDLLQTGRLRGKLGEETDRNYQPGDLIVYPTPSFRDVALDVSGSIPMEKGLDDPERAKTNAIYDASFYGETHAVLATLGLPRDSERILAADNLLASLQGTDLHPSYFQQPEVQDAIAPFVYEGVPVDSMQEAVRVGRGRKGFVVGISTEVQNDPGIEITEGDTNNDDLYLRTGKEGLSYRHISSVRPQGPQEEMFMQLLKGEAGFNGPEK